MTDMHLALGANHTARMREEMMSYRTFMRRTGSRLPTRVEGSNYMTVSVTRAAVETLLLYSSARTFCILPRSVYLIGGSCFLSAP